MNHCERFFFHFTKPFDKIHIHTHIHIQNVAIFCCCWFFYKKTSEHRNVNRKCGNQFSFCNSDLSRITNECEIRRRLKASFFTFKCSDFLFASNMYNSLFNSFIFHLHSIYFHWIPDFFPLITPVSFVGCVSVEAFTFKTSICFGQ